MVHANLLARLSRLVVPTPIVISTIHNENEGAQWRYVAYRLTSRLSDVTTAVSRVALAEATRRGAAPAGSILLVPNGLSTAPYAPDRPPANERARRLALATASRGWRSAASPRRRATTTWSTRSRASSATRRTRRS